LEKKKPYQGQKNPYQATRPQCKKIEKSLVTILVKKHLVKRYGRQN
jgi:hypothetical protein